MNNEQKLKELQEQYDKLGEKIKALEEAGNGKRWKPDFGDKYWCVHNSSGSTSWGVWRSDEYDQWCYNEKNVFRTREQAEAVRDAKLAIYELVGDYEPDWNDMDEFKYFVVYVPYSKRFLVLNDTYNQGYGQIYFPNKKTTQKAISHFQVLLDNGAF